MLSEQATKICAICPHASDCASAGSCLDDVNTKYLADSRQQFPRLMTPFQANRCAGLLQSGWTLRRLYNGGGVGPSSRSSDPESISSKIRLTSSSGSGIHARESASAEQNSTRVDHLQSVQQTGNAVDLPDAIRTQRDTADQRSKEIVDQLGDEHQAELAKLQEMKPNGSPSDVASLFRDQRDALDRATQTTVENAEKNAQKYRDQIPASSPENVGAALRAPAQAARDAAKEREKQLWNAVDPDGKLAVSMSPVQAAA